MTSGQAEWPVRPFLKWAGGKGRLLTQLMPLLPPGVENMRHVEPFLGGGALFFARRPQWALLCDSNPALIATYTTVRDRVEEVIDALGPLARGHSTDRYYEVRAAYNGNVREDPLNAARFIYLNKTCFNGLYRVNQKGHFNVPVGRSKSPPRILNADLLRAVSQQLSGVDIVAADFAGVLNRAKRSDFVYMDPPYEPVSRTANFTSYTTGGFSRDDQIRLRNVFDELTERGCKCMLSNSDTPFIRGFYAGHRIDTVQAARSVNCDASKRGKVAEVVVRNY